MVTDRASSLAVMGGWLGCQPKFLQRYEAMYNSLGFEVLSVVATPLSVIDSTLTYQSLPRNPIHVPSPSKWPLRAGANTESVPSARNGIARNRMQDLAWNVLADIHNSGADVFVFHCFSNGGCFLWESICRILLFRDNKDCNRQVGAVLQALHDKCNGVVFDSCPCWFGTKEEGSKLSQALRHCSLEERQAVRSVHGERIDAVDDDLVNRSIEFFEYLAFLPLDVPQLYLHSKNDELSNHEYIEKIIETRQLHQKCPVLFKLWEHSIHCNHLRKHHKDYTEALKAFIKELNVSYTNRARL
ncbi:unnamed protein product [Pseudo-nitzschia multistriata]|uniref:Uncharacterized protein n=1 Tax=Pseudo-nitzschia multistriata TaxID=183589 RepID=A0A448Z6H4_9STRA|nr:unnamed protein product [Pseudo-nitzschia multistriata]